MAARAGRAGGAAGKAGSRTKSGSDSRASARTRKKGKPRLTRDRVLTAAVAHADAHGLEGLNMRVLAGGLGCGVMSIYNHVENKDDLLDAMVEVVADEITEPSPGTPWREAIVAIAVSALRALMRHPWAAAHWWSRKTGRAKLAHQESILRVLREGGLPVGLACLGYHAVTMHVVGFSMQARDLPGDAKSMKAAATSFLRDADPEQIPYFTEHVRHHLEHPEPANEFVVVLEMILDGLEKSLKETAT